MFPYNEPRGRIDDFYTCHFFAPDVNMIAYKSRMIMSVLL